MSNVIEDLIDFILDIVNTWKSKDEKFVTKIFCTISTIIFLIIGIGIWLSI